eukprot:3316908-Rhodomonas_salina.1
MGVGSVGVGVLGTESDVGVLGTEGDGGGGAGKLGSGRARKRSTGLYGAPAAALVMGFASNLMVEIVAIPISAKRALETMMSPF